MASIEAAKSKAAAEKAFRSMVVHNNKTCALCNMGKEKIAKRRLEISATIKQEKVKRALRMASRRRESQKHAAIQDTILKETDKLAGKQTE